MTSFPHVSRTVFTPQEGMMKSSLYRTAMCLLWLTLSMIFLFGCHSHDATDAPGGDLNPGMSADQKATIAAHKQQTEQQAPTPQAAGQ